MAEPYDPLLRIDQRRRDEGGAVRTPALPRWRAPPGTAQEQRELVVLVHGFNNDRAEAAKAYAGLRKQQRALLGETHFPGFDAALGDDYWPGDADWGLFDFAVFLVYPQAVGVARDEVAVPLADYLRTRSDVQVVHFVGHSLGCRVVLETLADLSSHAGGPRVGKVCLMAAAVPVAMLCPGGRLEQALAVPREVLVLYSPNDLVLAAAFPAGQTLAGAGEGFFPEAVGLAGSVPAIVQREQITDAGHGHYWGDADKPATRQAAEALRAFLGFGPAVSRKLSARTVAATRMVADVREVASAA
jgi:pimeloyl-ACP methyl ester carboxylesterase